MYDSLDKLVYDISPAKTDSFKPVDQFWLFIKTMYPFWGDNVRHASLCINHATNFAPNNRRVFVITKYVFFLIRVTMLSMETSR